MSFLYESIKNYHPVNQQEKADKELMLRYMEENTNYLLRENQTAHFSASLWTVNRERTATLMVYHNIYQSWSWTGGHADGEEDLCAVALREAGEETGLKKIRLISREACSLDILPVWGHWKRGQYVSSHQHLNLTYLLAAPESAAVRIKEDENSGVAWIPLEELKEKVTEREMLPVYEKIIRKWRHF